MHLTTLAHTSTRNTTGTTNNEKVSTDWLPRNQTLFDRNRSPTNKCQSCNVEIETERHFLWCEKNSQNGGKLHESPRKAFNKHTVDPNIRQLILQGLVYAISAEPSKEPDPVTEIRDTISNGIVTNADTSPLLVQQKRNPAENRNR
eukprot:scaffold1173_cov37-Attheya_sp.AAC.2